MNVPAIHRALAIGALCLPVLAAPQEKSGVVVGIVAAQETGERLPYTLVALSPLGRERFTNDSGSIVFGQLPEGPLRIAARRLGYAPAHADVYVRPGSLDTIRLELSRIAVKLAEVTVRAYPSCTNPGIRQADSGATLATVLSQLVLNAEQYRVLVETYPFRYAMQFTESRRLKKNGTVIPSLTEVRFLDALPSASYKPGRVIGRRRGAYYFSIPGLIDFAHPSFLAAHCFHYVGIQGLNEADLLRIDVVAADTIRTPDVNGSIYLDPTTFQIRRSVLRLSRELGAIRPVTGMEVTTDFAEVRPNIPVISSVWSVQTIDPKARRDYDAAYDRQQLIGVQFRGAKPGEPGERGEPPRPGTSAKQP